MTAALKRIVEEVKRLSELERRELHTLLQRACAEAIRPMPELELKQNLAEEGLLTLPTPPPPATAALPPPIRTCGRPLSEILLEERR